jgi:predicted XRE-type DNA-binding protein
MTQGEAAKFLSLSQPRVSDLLRGKLSKFNLEMLISLAERCGHNVEIIRGAAA